MRVLIVADAKSAAFMRSVLRSQGILGDVAASAADALWMAGSTHYDVISLEAGRPGLDGFAACRRLRERGVGTPIVMLVGRNAVAERVAGLDAGADDCIGRPFHMAELLARMRALARRAPRPRPPVLSVGDLRFDLATCEVHRGGCEVRLTQRERDLLEVLMRQPGRTLSRAELLDGAWEGGGARRSNVVDVYVRYLRRKLDHPFGVRTIETVPGVGYRLTAA
jgi:two-component system OmpR family response regulator